VSPIVQPTQLCMLKVTRRGQHGLESARAEINKTTLRIKEIFSCYHIFGEIKLCNEIYNAAIATYSN